MAPRWRAFEKALKSKKSQISKLKLELKYKPLSVKIEIIDKYIDQLTNFSRLPNNIQYKLSYLKLIRELNELKMLLRNSN
jgi:hypothetical protein